MLLRVLSVVAGMLLTSQAYSNDYTSHSTISMYRSSYTTYSFFSQSIEGGFGSVILNKNKINEQSKDWKSLNLRSEFGIETLKFFQLSAGFIKSDYFEKGVNSSVMDKYSGFAELKIVLSAPMMNIEIGGGSTASMMDVVNENGTGSYAGSGIYYTASVSRYLNSRLAVFGRGTLNQQHYVLDSGNLENTIIDIKDKSLGFGLKLYL